MKFKIKKLFTSRLKARGFTLLELLITISIIALLSGGSLMAYRGQVKKANDGRRKQDLNKLKLVVEDYYMDHNCYPDSLPSCGEAFLPYLNEIPCEPGGKKSYFYVPEESSCPQYYRFYTKLDNASDPAIAAVGCASGCGPEGTYSWGVSSSNVSIGTGFVSGSPPPPACPSYVYVSCMGTICNYLSQGDPDFDPNEVCSKAWFCNDCGGCVDEFGEAIASKQCN